MMKFRKNTYKIWMGALLLGMATLPSCEKETLNVTFDEVLANTLTLNLVCSENQSSRAADNTNNEDAIHRLDIFLYPLDAGFDTPSVGDPITLTGINKNESHSFSVPLDNAVIESLFGKDEDADKVDNCRIYVIANLPAGTTLPTGYPTVNQLKALSIAGSFAQFAQVNGATTSTYQPQTDFVMDSDFTIDIETINNISVTNDQVTLDRTTHKLTGRVPLYRAASKISLEITAVNPVTLTNENNEPVYGILEDGSFRTEKNDGEEPIKWVANTTGMQVRLHDGVKNGFIDYSKQSSDEQKLDDADYYSFYNSENQTSLDVPMVKADDETIWRHNPAFYSYSSNWGEGGSDKDPYLTLIVPWQLSTQTNSYESTYYQIPINTITKKLERNTHYKISLVVSRLGSLVEEKPEVISPSSYIIIPWESETVNADLMDYRYLMVEEKDVKIYNENEIRIPYASSHEVNLELVRCTHENLNNGNDESVSLTQGVHYYLEDGYIVYHKDLINDFTSTNFDFTPYEVELKISHTTATSTGVIMSETVKITQYPAIYGERDVNTDAENGGGASGDNGFVWVNGYQGSSHKGDIPYRYVISENTDNHYVGYFDNATSGLSGSGDVTSNTMLVFTISSVQGTKYVIGDPREETINSSFINATHEVNNKSYSIWEYAPDVEGAEPRLLTNYYATDTNHASLKNASTGNATQNAIYTSDTQAAENERTYNMIAPKFRISSGYGAISSSGDRRYYHLMKKRCASYQEDGYPAGRWRLPTKAEFEFIIYLSYANKIPKLFSTSLNYWCAHGYGQPQTANGSVKMGYKTDFGSSSVSVRCVYDDWYWGSDPVIDTKNEEDKFIWGDQPR